MVFQLRYPALMNQVLCSYDDDKGIIFESYYEDWSFIEIHFPQMFGRSILADAKADLLETRWTMDQGGCNVRFAICFIMHNSTLNVEFIPAF